MLLRPSSTIWTTWNKKKQSCHLASLLRRRSLGSSRILRDEPKERLRRRLSSGFLKLVNNLLRLNKRNHDCDGAWYLILISKDFYNLNSIFSLVLNSNETVEQRLKTVIEHISKHLEFRQNYSAVRCINFQLPSRCLDTWSNTFFRVWNITSSAHRLTSLSS